MTAKILDGTILAAAVRDEARRDVAHHVEKFGAAPGLATVLVGTDPASEIYVRRKRSLAIEIGLADYHHHLSADVSEKEVADVIDQLVSNSDVAGILLQLPLPAGLRSEALIDRIPASKDVDGLTTPSAGLLARGEPGLRPCTPSGVMRLLAETGRNLTGAEAVVVGRSQLVGRPMAQLLVEQDCTVTLAHSRTRSLAEVTSRADILIAAAGVAQLIGREHVKEGAIVIDVGIHRTIDGLVGDVRFDEVRQKASWITPVPGGVGPMTIAMLLQNTATAALAAKNALPIKAQAHA